MIKKSIDTIKRNKIVWIGILAIFIYMMVSTMQDRAFAMKYVVDGYEPTTQDYMNGFLFAVVMAVVYSVFIMGPFIRLSYEGAMGKAQKGWYAKGMARGFLLYLPIMFLFSLLDNFLNTQVIMFYAKSGNYMMTGLMMPIVSAIMHVLVLLPFYFMIIPIISEKKIGDGFKNIFKVAGKYFFGFLLLYICTFAVYTIVAQICAVLFYWIENTSIYLIMFIANAINAMLIGIMFIVGANMYVSKRAEMMEIENKNKEVEDV